MTGGVRIGTALLGAALLVGTGGCGRSTVNYGSAEMAGRLAGTVRHVAEEHGYPVEDDHVGCGAPDPSGTVTCYGSTTDQPTTDIHATFTPSGQGCSGVLSVDLSGSSLAPRTADPCH